MAIKWNPKKLSDFVDTTRPSHKITMKDLEKWYKKTHSPVIGKFLKKRRKKK